MPTYQAPTFEALQEAIANLGKLYTGNENFTGDETYSSNEKKRVATIKRIQAIAKQCTTRDSQQVLLGLLVMGLEEITAGYKVLSPQEKTLGIIPKGGSVDWLLNKTLGEKTLRLFKTGSSLDGLLRKALGLSSQNGMDKYHKLMYLTALNARLANHATDSEFAKSVATHLAAVTAECKAEIDALEKKRFSATVVKQNFADIPLKYAKRKKDCALHVVSAKPKPEDYPKLNPNELCLYQEDGALRYVVKDRNEKIQAGELTAGSDKDQLEKDAIQFLQQTLARNPLPTKAFYINDPSLNEAGKKAVKALFELTAKRKHTQANVTSREALLALIRTVDKKLQGSDEAVTNYSFNNTIRYALIVYIMEVLEAEYTTQSELYNLSQEAINLKHTSQLSILEKYNYYSALHAFLPKLNPHAEERCNWLVAPIPNAKQFLSDMTGKLLRKMSAAYEALENGHVYTTLNGLRTIINMAMTFGIGIVIGSFAGGLVTLTSEQKIFSRTIASLARARYGITAKIVAEQAAVVIEQAAVTSVVSTSLKKATNYIATVPGNAVYYTLSIPANIGVAIQKMLSAPPEKKFQESIEFINTLISLPDTLVPKATKEKLQKIELYMPEIMPQEKTLTAQPKLRRSMSI